MDITRVLSDRACAFPAGLFHHASIHNGTVYTTGQIGGDVTGRLAGSEVSAQAEQLFANLSAILQSANSSLEHVLSASIFLTNTADYTAFNEAYVR
ncbi:hypothetical protein B0A48_13044 [Cryoendolithus antarcticus]|uniref:RidA family protein n=1 Tax=Cryoendolithus antarcticus TaxID=1507870 RepID=A0A1V8SNA1_9PEZI|nr:hypothetical protein B0A48_13044 [Cryoendolithus antarcticus]